MTAPPLPGGHFRHWRKYDWYRDWDHLWFFRFRKTCTQHGIKLLPNTSPLNPTPLICFFVHHACNISMFPIWALSASWFSVASSSAFGKTNDTINIFSSGTHVFVPALPPCTKVLCAFSLIYKMPTPFGPWIYAPPRNEMHRGFTRSKGPVADSLNRITVKDRIIFGYRVHPACISSILPISLLACIKETSVFIWSRQQFFQVIQVDVTIGKQFYITPFYHPYYRDVLRYACNCMVCSMVKWWYTEPGVTNKPVSLYCCSRFPPLVKYFGRMCIQILQQTCRLFL